MCYTAWSCLKLMRLLDFHYMKVDEAMSHHRFLFPIRESKIMISKTVALSYGTLSFSLQWYR